MVRYLLFTTKGEIFDKLVDYIGYHSLTDLLVELMQLKVTFEDKALEPAAMEEDDDSGFSDDSEEKPSKNED
jgi:HEPN domain-containing protein